MPHVIVLFVPEAQLPPLQQVLPMQQVPLQHWPAVMVPQAVPSPAWLLVHEPFVQAMLVLHTTLLQSWQELPEPHWLTLEATQVVPPLQQFPAPQQLPPQQVLPAAQAPVPQHCAPVRQMLLQQTDPAPHGLVSQPIACCTEPSGSGELVSTEQAATMARTVMDMARQRRCPDTSWLHKFMSDLLG
jgi:hypothetical protein